MDSDIFIWEKEFEKELNQQSQTEITKQYGNIQKYMESRFFITILHEFGHFIGLDHNFSNTPSIMDYSARNEIQVYDKEAVRYLYPVNVR